MIKWSSSSWTSPRPRPSSVKNVMLDETFWVWFIWLSGSCHFRKAKKEYYRFWPQYLYALLPINNNNKKKKWSVVVKTRKEHETLLLNLVLGDLYLDKLSGLCLFILILHMNKISKCKLEDLWTNTASSMLMQLNKKMLLLHFGHPECDLIRIWAIKPLIWSGCFNYILITMHFACI